MGKEVKVLTGPFLGVGCRAAPRGVTRRDTAPEDKPPSLTLTGLPGKDESIC